MNLFKKYVLCFALLLLSGCASKIIIHDSNFQLPADYSKKHALVNKKVVFLPTYPSTQHYGYQSYDFQQKISGRHPKYNSLVGKKAEIIGYKDARYPDAILRVEELNWILFTHVTNGSFNDVGFVSEMENAQQYIGKKVWNKGHPTDNHADRHGYIKCDKNIGKLEQVKITNIKWSTDESSPLRFMFQTNDGFNGYWDGSYSKINDGSSGLAMPFSENWYLEDPRTIHSDWPKKIWYAIENEEVLIGMSKEQVLLSWRKPRKINRTVGTWGVHEQWVYSSQYLYFKDGLLTSFQGN